jgi:hypothetical protein
MGSTSVLASYPDGGGNHVNFQLNVLIWKDDKVHYVYSPALDMTGYGNTHAEAKRSFEVQLAEFANYTNNKGTLYKELERLGWTVNKKKKRVKAPDYQEMLQDNETLRELSGRSDVMHTNKAVELALC